MDQRWIANTKTGVDLDILAAHLLAIVGPSGSGKTTLAALLQKARPDVTHIPHVPLLVFGIFLNTARLNFVQMEAKSRNHLTFNQ